MADSSNVVLAAGDIAGDAKDNPGMALTTTLVHELLDEHPEATIFALGDNAYYRGTKHEYETFYRPTWGDDRSPDSES